MQILSNMDKKKRSLYFDTEKNGRKADTVQIKFTIG